MSSKMFIRWKCIQLYYRLYEILRAGFILLVLHCSVGQLGSFSPGYTNSHGSDFMSWVVVQKTKACLQDWPWLVPGVWVVKSFLQWYKTLAKLKNNNSASLSLDCCTVWILPSNCFYFLWVRNCDLVWTEKTYVINPEYKPRVLNLQWAFLVDNTLHMLSHFHAGAEKTCPVDSTERGLLVPYT